MKILSSLQQRFLIAILLSICSLALLFYTPAFCFIVFAFILFLVMFLEYSLVATKKKFLALALVLFFIFRSYSFSKLDSQEIFTWLSQQFLIAALLVLVSMPFAKKKKIIFLFFLGCLWLAIPFFFLLGIFSFAEYKKLFLFLLLIIIVNDSFAYFIGKKWGKRKIAPYISPNKTLLGCFAGILFAILIALLFNKFWHLFTWQKTIFLALIISITGQLGDLFASKQKRLWEVKDYGKLLLSHGGVLDRLDSILFALPIYYYFIFFLAK